MPVIQFPNTHTQIEFPAEVNGKKLARSCVGALHVRPGGTLTITPDELAFLKAQKGLRFRVLSEKDPVKAVPAKTTARVDAPPPGSGLPPSGSPDAGDGPTDGGGSKQAGSGKSGKK